MKSWIYVKDKKRSIKVKSRGLMTCREIESVICYGASRICRSDYCCIKLSHFLHKFPLSNSQSKLQTLEQQYQAQIEAVKLQQDKIDVLQKMEIQHSVNEAISVLSIEINQNKLY